jgi:hypothetical protein
MNTTASLLLWPSLFAAAFALSFFGDVVLAGIRAAFSNAPQPSGEFVAEIGLARSLGGVTLLWSQRFDSDARANAAVRRKLRRLKKDLPHVRFAGAGKVQVLADQEAALALRTNVRRANAHELKAFESVDRKDIPLFI